MVRSAIPPHILKQLEHIDPDARFSGDLPRVTSSSGRTYFAKAGSPREREQYVGEAESLRAMALAAPGLVPSLLAFGFVDENGEDIDRRDGDDGEGSPFFISEYKHLTPLTERSGATLGRRLATEMHAADHHASPPNGCYGFEVPTFCGATRRLVRDVGAVLRRARGGFVSYVGGERWILRLVWKGTGSKAEASMTTVFRASFLRHANLFTLFV
jgi:hypothetical protein